MKKTNTGIGIEFEISIMKESERTPTEEDFKKHFGEEQIEEAKQIFTSYDPETETFKG